MKRKLKQTIEEAHRNTKRPVEPRSVLFIENYNRSTSGNCQAVLWKCLQDPRFADWHFYWTVPNDYYMENVLPGISDQRIEFLLTDARRYHEKLETAKVIVTGQRLPFSYIKRNGQVLTGIFTDAFYQPDPWLSQQRASYHLMLRNTDLLYAESRPSADAIRNLPEGLFHGTMIEGSPLRFLLEKQPETQIIASFAARSSYVASFSALERSFKALRYRTADAGCSIRFHIPDVQYRTFQKENAPDILPWVSSSRVPLCCLIGEQTRVLITNRQQLLEDGLRAGLQGIYISERRMLPEVLDAYRAGKISLAGNWDEAVEICGLLVKKPFAGKAEDGIAKQAEAGLDALLTQILQKAEEHTAAGEEKQFASYQKGFLKWSEQHLKNVLSEELTGAATAAHPAQAQETPGTETEADDAATEPTDLFAENIEADSQDESSPVIAGTEKIEAEEGSLDTDTSGDTAEPADSHMADTFRFRTNEEDWTSDMPVDRDLLVLSASLAGHLLGLLHLCRFERPVDVLVRETDRDRIWKKALRFPADSVVSCRTGGDAAMDLLTEKSDCQKECRRMTGNVRYANVIYVGAHSEVWTKLLEKGMDANVSFLSAEEFLKKLLEVLDNPVLSEACDGEQKPLSLCSLNGEEHYYLGSGTGKRYYLKKKEPVNEPWLVFVSSEDDVAAISDEIRKDERNRTFFLFDSQKLFPADSETAKQGNVYRLVTNMLPLQIFLQCETLHRCRDACLIRIAEHFGKKVTGSGQVDFSKDAITRVSRLLGAERQDEMIMLSGDREEYFK